MALMNKMTIIKRILLWLCAMSLVWFLVLAFIVLQVRETVRQDGLNHLQKILLHKMDALNTYVVERHIAIDHLTQFFSFTSQHHPIFDKSFWISAPHTLQQNLATFQEKSGFYDIFLITLSGDVVYTFKHENDLHTNLLNGPYKNTQLARVFQDALDRVNPYISDFDYYEPSNEDAAFIAKPIIVEGKMIGVLAVQIENKVINSVINDYSELGKTGAVVTSGFCNNRSTNKITSRHCDMKGCTSCDSFQIAAIKNALKGECGQQYTADKAGHDVAVAWGYQKDLHWAIAVQMEEYELLDSWYQLATSLMILFFSGILVIGFMVIMAFRSFSRPIHELTRYAHMVSSGHYDIQLQAKGYDHEWQVLIYAFKDMLVEINREMAQLNDQNSILSVQKKEIEELNRTLESRIKEKSQKLQEYINIIDHYVITSQTDKNGVIINVSDAFCKISGYSREELIGKSHSIIRHPDMPDSLFKDIWSTITSGKIWHGEIKNLKADGGYYWVDTTISPNIEEGEIVGYTAVRYDISDKKIIEELAITDPMTGLYNRRFYIKTINEEMNRIKRHASSLALLMIDVDNFKLYNDTYGHQAGDDVLAQVSDIFKFYTSRSGEYAFRLGGEEFGIIISGMNRDEYIDFANRIRHAIEMLKIVHEKNNAAPYVTISIGIALYYSNSKDKCEDLYREADKQLYRAKEDGRNQVVIAE